MTPDPRTNEQQLAERVVNGMLSRDEFTRLLGIELLKVAPDTCECRMTVRPEMVNGFGVAHGGIVFSLADSAFAFACNTHGKVTVSIENSITYPLPIRPGDVLTAVAQRDAGSNRLSYYRVDVRNQEAQVVGLFRGTAYVTSRPHFTDDR